MAIIISMLPSIASLDRTTGQADSEREQDPDWERNTPPTHTCMLSLVAVAMATRWLLDGLQEIYVCMYPCVWLSVGAQHQPSTALLWKLQNEPEGTGDVYVQYTTNVTT